MSSQTPAPLSEKPASQLKAFFGNPRLVPMINYLLFFIFLMSLGFAGIIAITLVYLFQDNAPDWLKSHYEFQKRTFWIGIALVIGLIVITGLKIPFLAWVAFGSVFIWTVGRSVVGFNHLVHNRPYPTPKGWLI